VKKVEIEKPNEYLELVASKAKEYLYHDHPSEGIDFFCDEYIEDIGYQAVVFDFITYRGIAEFIEENCEGTLTFNDHPMGFNGFVEVDDIEKVRVQVKEYVINLIEKNKLDEYNDEQLEALKFLGIAI
jgi:hypothetical protein